MYLCFELGYLINEGLKFFSVVVLPTSSIWAWAVAMIASATSAAFSIMKLYSIVSLEWLGRLREVYWTK